MSRIATTDQSLIDRLGLNDTDAFEELYRQYWHSLFLYSLRKLQSPDDAKKIVRIIFTELWEQRHTLPVSFSLSQHLYGEVRKMVVRSLSERLANNSDRDHVENRFTHEFSVQSLLAARKPISATYKVADQPSELIRQRNSQNHPSMLSSVRWMLQSFTNKIPLVNILSYPKN